VWHESALDGIRSIARDAAAEADHAEERYLHVDKKICQIDDGIQGLKQRSELQHIGECVGLVNISKELNLALEERRLEVLKWLLRTDALAFHNSEYARHETGTGLWFLQRKEYTEWRVTPNSFLWLYGKSGSGKTVLL
jgi:hypothetical protein